MKEISRDQMRSMPWKNGGGTTVEIAIEPAGSNVSTDPFLWRVSSATVASPGPFSRFENYDRALMALTKPGLELNGQTLGPLETIHFHGETDIFCRPLGSAIQDIGVIYQRGKFEVEMKAKSGDDISRDGLSGHAEVLRLNSTFFVFDVETGNAWKFDPGTRLDLAPFGELTNFIFIRINAVT